MFGAREVRRSCVPDLNPAIEIVFLHLAGGFHVELIGGGTPDEPSAPETISDAYARASYRQVGFTIADMDATLAHLAREGGEPAYRVTREDYGVEIVLIKEPSGRFVELYAPLD